MTYATIHGRIGTKAIPYVPPGFDGPPQTPSEVIAAAAAVISEEERWITGEWFRHDDPSHADYEDNPYCNGWGTCAEGALQIVSIGAVWTKTETESCDDDDCLTCRGVWDAPSPNLNSVEFPPSRERLLFTHAREFVHNVIGDLHGYDETHIPRFNDRSSRADVLAVFAEAQHRAERLENATGPTAKDAK